MSFAYLRINDDEHELERVLRALNYLRNATVHRLELPWADDAPQLMLDFIGPEVLVHVGTCVIKRRDQLQLALHNTTAWRLEFLDESAVIDVIFGVCHFSREITIDMRRLVGAAFFKRLIEVSS